MALPRLYAFTNTQCLRDGRASSEDIYFSPDTGLITPNYARSRPEISEYVTRIDLGDPGLVVAPGFLEIQINGFAGVHFTSLDQRHGSEKLDEVARQLVKYGVTGFLPTVPTVEVSRFQQILPLLKPRSVDGGAMILGAHVEGPFLHPDKHGAHDAGLFKIPESTPYTDAYGEANLRSIIKMLTLAPELPGSIESIKSVRRKYPNITISLGHSTATYEQGQDALVAGARGLTHLYNAMSPLNHRDPGLAGLIANNAASDVPKESLTSPTEHLLSSTTSVSDWLARNMAGLSPSSTQSKSTPDVFFSLIADLIHVHPSLLTMSQRTAPHRCILTTDSIELATLDDGVYPPNDRIKTQQRKQGNRATMVDSDTLIGSCITLDQCVRNMVEYCGCSLAEAVRCVTENVASYFDQCDTTRGRGRLDVGYRADFVILDHKGYVRQTWIGGTKVWDADATEEQKLSPEI